MEIYVLGSLMLRKYNYVGMITHNFNFGLTGIANQGLGVENTVITSY